jgi:hypothetical protein
MSVVRKVEGENRFKTTYNKRELFYTETERENKHLMENLCWYVCVSCACWCLLDKHFTANDKD